MWVSRRGLLSGAASAAAVLSFPAAKGRAAGGDWGHKAINFYVGIPPGGSYDLFPRILAAHMPKYLPGSPRIVVENMPGAASLTMMNYLYNQAARDGTAVGFPMNTVLLEPKLKLMSRSGGAVNFDLSRVSWLGTPGADPAVVWVAASSPCKTFKQLKTAGLRFAATAPSADSYLDESLCNRLLGTNIKVISGYQGLADYIVAFERGEVDGAVTDYAGLSVSRPDWIKNGKIRILAQFGEERSSEMPDVPTAIELADDDNTRSMLRLFSVKYSAAYPIVLPPDVPAERYEMLRTAFINTSKDPEYLAQLSKLHLASGTNSPEAVEQLVKVVNQASPAVVNGLRAALIVK